MKISTTFVLIAAAFTGSADAAKIIQGNLYADVFAGTNEDPAAASPQETFMSCLAKCSKTSRSMKGSDDIADTTEEDVSAGLASCAMACYGTDEATRSKLRGVISEEKLKTCATEAADRFREVSGKSCGSFSQSMKCSKCSDDTDDSCKREERRCEQCASQLRRSQSSLRRVGRAFQECIAPESAVVVDISVQEEPAPAADPAELQLEECVSSCSVLGKPNKRSVPSTSRNDIEAGLKGCLETCYDIASNSDAIVKNRLTNQVPMDVALGCAETAAKKYRQVSGKCSTMKSIKCKSCKSGDCGDCKGVTDPDELKKCESEVKKCEKKLDKCEKEYDDCTKCASQARRARSSVKRVAKELDKCIAGVEDTESAVEIA